MAKKTRTRGIISQIEKVKIQEMINQGLDVEKIGQELGRKPVTIQKYIDDELAPLIAHVAAAQLQHEKTKVQDALDEQNFEIPQEMMDAALKLLTQAGIELARAKDLMRKTVSKLTGVPDSAHDLYMFSLMATNSLDAMVTKTQEGRGGLAMMTAAASTRMDAFKKKPHNISRTARGNIWRPKEGRMADDD